MLAEAVVCCCVAKGGLDDEREVCEAGHEVVPAALLGSPSKDESGGEEGCGYGEEDG